jgi:peptidoglycan/LPS O-acetylase OafA/YrhL
LNWKGIVVELLPDLFFYQNYRPSFWEHHWSLAVEEHFYVFLTVLIFILAKLKLLGRHKLFMGIALFIFILCLALRYYAYNYHFEEWGFGETQFRMDSLFAGVLISYFHAFQKEKLTSFYQRFKYLIFFFVIAPAFFMPFLKIDESSFLPVFGLTLLYISFGSLLLVFIFTKTISVKLSTLLTKPLFWCVTRIGFYSYGIYLFHMYYLKLVTKFKYAFPVEGRTRSPELIMDFVIYFSTAVAVGAGLSKLVEIPFLRLRERYFPRRAIVGQDKQF